MYSLYVGFVVSDVVGGGFFCCGAEASVKVANAKRTSFAKLIVEPLYWFSNPRTSLFTKKPRRAGICFINGAPERIRTPDLLIRSQALYPAELRALDIICIVLP